MWWAGDPTPLGWATTLAYLVAAGLAVVCARRSADRAVRWAWAVVALAMLGLGLNKELDLQVTVTRVAREIATSNGWYELRGLAYAAFVAVLAVGLAGLAAAAPVLRRGGRGLLLAVSGLAISVVFVGVSATTQAPLAELEFLDTLPLALDQLLEDAGIVTVVAGALLALRTAGTRAGARSRGSIG